MAEWVRDSRLNGVLRYHLKTIGRIVIWALLIVLVTQLLSLLTPLMTGHAYPFDGIRANFEIVFFAALVTGIVTAGRSSKFLLRFGTSRTAVWLGNELGLLAGMVGLLLATLVVNMAVAALLFPLASMFPPYFSMNATLYRAELVEGIKGLPDLLLYTVEWTAMLYFYACMLRRYKALTISLSVGIPLMFVIMMLIPAVREALTVINSENQGQLMLLGMKWLQIINDILRFIENNWDALQLAGGIASLPLSYLVMRGTKQP